LIKWSYVIICKNFGYISEEKLLKEKTKEISYLHIGGDSQSGTSGDIKLMKVRT
jgi:hypothetical protein